MVVLWGVWPLGKWREILGYISDGEEGVSFKRSVFPLHFELRVAGVPPGVKCLLVRMLRQYPLEELMEVQAVMQIS